MIVLLKRNLGQRKWSEAECLYNLFKDDPDLKYLYAKESMDNLYFVLLKMLSATPVYIYILHTELSTDKCGINEEKLLRKRHVTYTARVYKEPQIIKN